jgi:membrane fusion protein, multidrug efflux system
LALLSALAGLSCERRGDAARLPEVVDPAPSSGVTTPGAPGGAAEKWAGSSSADAGSDLSGTTEAHRKSTLTPKVSSTVTKVFVREGDVVRAGQLLVAMDTKDFALRTQAAEATLEQAKVGMDATQLEWTRVKGLVDEKALPQAQFDGVDARLKGAKASVSAAETAVAMGRKALADASVVAPFAGIVVKRHVNEGEYAAMMPPTPVITLEEIDPIDLRIQVPSANMDRVHVGDSVRVRFPANAREVMGKIARIVPANDPRTRSFSAIVELANADRSLRSGLYAEVELTQVEPAKARNGR